MEGSLGQISHYHFRYMAIGCTDADQKADFYDTCCHPRLSNKESDESYPAACQLSSYLVFDPEYKDNKVVAKLGSLRDYQKKIGYEDKDVKDSSSSSEKKKPTSSSEAPSSKWTPESSSKSSSSSQWTPSSSSSNTWTPEATPSSSSSQWTPPAPSSSSSSWTPEAAPSSSSAPAWTEPSKKEEAAWTPSSSSSYQAPAPSSNNNNNNGGGSSGDFTGQASWFTQNGNPGACGIYHSDSDHIVALQVDMVSSQLLTRIQRRY